LRGEINKENGHNGWTLSGMLSFLRTQPKLPPYLLQDDLTIQAYNHTEWMKSHGYGHTESTTRGADLPGFSITTASEPDHYDHDSTKYGSPRAENISFGYNTEYPFETSYQNGTLSRDGYIQRLAYEATMIYILDAGLPDLGHLRNLLGRPDSFALSGGGNKQISNLDSIGIDQSFMRYQQIEDVPNYYLTTHRLDNVRQSTPQAGQYVSVSFTDTNRNGLFDVGESYQLQTGQGAGGGGFSLALAGESGVPSGGGRASRDASLSRDEVQMFRLVAPAGARLVVETSAVSGGRDVDTYLRLFSSTGAELKADDDGGTGFYSRIEHTFASAGTYYVGIS
jgi:pre-peptidase